MEIKTGNGYGEGGGRENEGKKGMIVHELKIAKRQTTSIKEIASSDSDGSVTVRQAKCCTGFKLPSYC